ncbi:TIGR01459 family HAD-type hydrolase [Martelella mediterranea]|uniref:HAD superfamily hydrolase (TIGR01459 family) n=1 Tax=Martelella mediterranea TaxID=293089 RepID=A0A4R3NPT0_9HYPH|nr:TIGR01459 family HAD-type hydrolase [Martelella mediterranea]TCT37886.1 HAD superfamily hydrolase (TIGR01459 family) [Martelella mediterranea]
MAESIQALSTVTKHYDVVLCDVWGVLHNGVSAYDGPKEALKQAREDGKKVILLTNSPRLSTGVAGQLLTLGISDESYDAIVTSGDVTRTLVAEGPRKLFFLGPDRDIDLIEGTGVELVPEEDAQGILCTGLIDDETETAEDYREMLSAFQKRALPFICANPDLIVSRGDKLVPCAGALAALYDTLGGETRIAGKPHKPIYDAACVKAKELGAEADKARILAIGDGMPTDVKGALDYGLDLLFVAEGIHEAEYSDNGTVDAQLLDRFLTQKNAHPKYWMPKLA